MDHHHGGPFAETGTLANTSIASSSSSGSGTQQQQPSFGHSRGAVFYLSALRVTESRISDYVGSEDESGSAVDETIELQRGSDSEPTRTDALLDLVEARDSNRKKPRSNMTGSDPKYSTEEEFDGIDHQNARPESPNSQNPRSESPPPQDTSILPSYGIAI